MIIFKIESFGNHELENEITVRKSTDADIDAIYELTIPFVKSRQLLSRTREEISELIVGGFVAKQVDAKAIETVVGFAAVEIYSKKLAEILCLAVSEACQGKGVGKMLVQRCVEFANEKGVVELMAISSSDHFLKSCGFDYTLPDQKRALFINPSDFSCE